MYIFIFIYIFIYIYIYIYIFIKYIFTYIFTYIYIHSWKQCALPSRLPQWPCGKSCTWAHDVQSQLCLLYAQVHDLPQSYCSNNWEGTLFS